MPGLRTSAGPATSAPDAWYDTSIRLVALAGALAVLLVASGVGAAQAEPNTEATLVSGHIHSAEIDVVQLDRRGAKVRIQGWPTGADDAVTQFAGVEVRSSLTDLDAGFIQVGVVRGEEPMEAPIGSPGHVCLAAGQVTDMWGHGAWGILVLYREAGPSRPTRCVLQYDNGPDMYEAYFRVERASNGTWGAYRGSHTQGAANTAVVTGLSLGFSGGAAGVFSGFFQPGGRPLFMSQGYGTGAIGKAASFQFKDGNSWKLPDGNPFQTGGVDPQFGNPGSPDVAGASVPAGCVKWPNPDGPWYLQMYDDGQYNWGSVYWDGDGDDPDCSALPECANAADDDGDGKVDLADPGCSNSQDGSEAPDPAVQCVNGIDDDGDGRIDLADPGCTNAQDDSESPDPPPMCANGVDDDGDSKIDLADPGCESSEDNSESPDPPLLERFAPELRYDSVEGYRADSAATITDSFLPGQRTNELLDSQDVVLAAADPDVSSSAWPTPLSLNYLATYSGAAATDRLNEADSYQADADRLHAMTQYGNKMYGRIYQYNGMIALQYWFFYYYNPKTFHFAGNHEGDWEMVTVLLNSDGTQIGAAYAQHRYFESCAWETIEKTSDGRPIVYVGEGSHASYFHASPSPSGYIVYWNGLPEAYETADGGGAIENPSVTDVTDEPAWMMWPGRWGASTGVGPSPEGPPHQGFRWENPVLWALTDESQIPCREGGSGFRLNPGQISEKPRAQVAERSGTPPSPIVRARLDGNRVVIDYRFRSFPSRRDRRPWMLVTSVVSSSSRHSQYTVRTRVKSRVGRVVQRRGSGPGPYRLRVAVLSAIGTRSPVLEVPLRSK